MVTTPSSPAIRAYSQHAMTQQLVQQLWGVWMHCMTLLLIAWAHQRHRPCSKLRNQVSVQYAWYWTFNIVDIVHKQWSLLIAQLYNKKNSTNKRSLSLDRQRKREPSKRFSVVSEEDLALGCQGVVPANTKSSNKWAMRNLKKWMDSRSSSE